MNCPENTSNIPSNTPLPCDGGFIYDECVVHQSAIPFLSLGENATQLQINNAIVNTLINYSSMSQSFQAVDLTIDGNYILTENDNRKYYNVTSVLNNPRIVLDEALPNGFECYFLNATNYDDNVSDDAFLSITTEYTNIPFFTVPLQLGIQHSRVSNYGIIHIKKQNNNLYTVSGDLYDQGS